MLFVEFQIFWFDCADFQRSLDMWFLGRGAVCLVDLPQSESHIAATKVDSSVQIWALSKLTGKIVQRTFWKLP